MKTYDVILKFRFPAWDEKAGIPFEAHADNRKSAISMVRRVAHTAGHTIGRGPYWFTAKERTEIVKPTNDQDRDALAMLNRLVTNGVEYPDAEWRTFMQTGVPVSELREMYDDQ